ncbi:MAG TPA: hypothetical protein VGI55_07245 [Solirubrobacteraceae bacterium]
MRTECSFDSLTETLRFAASALRDAEVPFVLGGSLAVWARGGPTPQNDLDLMLAPGDAERALAVLGDAGLRPERPPEEWLLKVWHGPVMIDLILRPAGLEITREFIDRADLISVAAVAMPVMSIEDVLATKLTALTEHTLDYGPLLAMARAVREQIDWPRLQGLTAACPLAKPFFTLVEELGIAPATTRSPVAAQNAATGAKGIRVVN